MPIYQCVVPEGSVAPELRPRIAEAFMRIHSEVTGAAPDFVQVFFLDMPRGSAFTAGQPSSMTNISGYIRAGRPAAMRQQLYERINAMWTEITKTPLERLKITLFDVPTAWIMQGGSMMPEPGKDEEWLERRAPQPVSA